MPTNPKPIGWIIGFFIAVFLTWLMTRPQPPAQDHPIQKPRPPSIEKHAQAAPSPEAPPRIGPPPSPFARHLNDPALTAKDDVENVHTMLMLMQTASKGRFAPLGLNEEFTAALTGDNPARIPFLPPDHPTINARGQLTDRWGTPYHFHPLATDRVEIRSAGPDSQLFNDDDVLYSPWEKSPPTGNKD